MKPLFYIKDIKTTEVVIRDFNPDKSYPVLSISNWDNDMEPHFLTIDDLGKFRYIHFQSCSYSHGIENSIKG